MKSRFFEFCLPELILNSHSLQDASYGVYNKSKSSAPKYYEVL